MTLKEKYNSISIINKELIDRVIVYITSTNNTSIESILLECKYNIKQVLKHISNSNKEAILIRRERKKVREDLDDLERAYCKAASCEGVGEGKNTGGKVNNVEIRQIDKAKLRERLGELLIESQLLEKSLSDNNELMKSFINLLPQIQYAQVLELTYFECMTSTQIACELGYSIEYIDIARLRAIEGLSQIIKNHLKNQVK